MAQVHIWEIRGMIDKVPAERPPHEAIAELENIARYAAVIASRERAKLEDRQRGGSAGPFQTVGELVYDATDDTLERPFPADSLRER